MLVFYDAPISANTYKVRLLLRQLPIPHEVVRLDLVRGEARTAEYREVNPFGRVPFIVDDGFSLGESNAILMYLARGSPLLPADARGQALVAQWLFFEQNQSETALGLPRIWKKFTVDIPQAVFDHYHSRAVAALKVFERHLRDRAWLVGESYGVADISLFAYTHLAPEAGHDLGMFPAVNAWLQRVREQPGWFPMDRLA